MKYFLLLQEYAIDKHISNKPAAPCEQCAFNIDITRFPIYIVGFRILSKLNNFLIHYPYSETNGAGRMSLLLFLSFNYYTFCLISSNDAEVA